MTTEDKGKSKDESTGADEPTFSVAIDELEAILQRIDNDAVDVDGLAKELRRATDLLELCRGKIRKAEVEVSQIVQKLEGGTSQE
jgi:exodeoxyribonuclease VII small subunit